MTTEEIQRHFSGLYRFGKAYIQENRVTAGNLMELIVYVDELMRPHREWISDMMFHEVCENPRMEKDKIHAIHEHWESYRANLHPDYREQKQVHSLLNDELYQLRHQQEAAVKNNEHEPPPTRQRVKDFFEFLTSWDGYNNPHMLSEPDFQRLVGWVTFYFENDFAIPKVERPIYGNDYRNKRLIIYAFKVFFKNETGQPFPDSLFELIKACFNIMRNDDIENMRKAGKVDAYRKLQKYPG